MVVAAAPTFDLAAAMADSSTAGSEGDGPPSEVVRRGLGLVLERAGRPTYAVTVDNASEAADLVNALVTRHESATG